MEIEAEKKAKAVHHRQSKRHLKPLLLHALEACVALTLLLSLYSTPLSLAVDSAMDGCRQLAGFLRKPFPVFLLSNAIVVVIACLSRNNINNKKKTTPPATMSELSDNIYDEYLSRRRLPPPAPTDKLQIAPKPDPEGKENDKAVVVRVEEKIKTRYRRTKSDVAAVAGRPRREAALWRSATENGRSTVVEDLSNEEFKQTVESYIARTRWLLQKEITADLTETAAVADRSVVVWS